MKICVPDACSIDLATDLPKLALGAKSVDPDTVSVDEGLDDEELSEEETDEWDDKKQTGIKDRNEEHREAEDNAFPDMDDLQTNETRCTKSGYIFSRV